MTAQKHTATRRAVLGAALTIPAVAAMGGVPTPSVERGAWDVALAQYTKAAAKCADHDARFDTIHDLYQAQAPDMKTMIPWSKFPFETRGLAVKTMDTEQRWASFLAGEGKTWHSARPEKTKADMRAALDAVKEYQRLEKECDERLGYSVEAERNDKLYNDMTDIAGRLLRMPAPDPEALLWKIEYLFGGNLDDGGDSNDCWSMEVVGPMILDARRLLSGARA